MTDLIDALRHALAADYTIERELGGGMSRVFLARENRLDRAVVIKVLPSEAAADAGHSRFEREMRIVAQLQHPLIVPVLSAGTAAGLPYYIMPFVEGESLQARLEREHELPVADVRQILRDVLDALAYAHDHGVVHRDIKPDNILLTTRHAVLTDFGVAKAMQGGPGSNGKLTVTGVTVGTPLYMAPEQIAADPDVDHRADMYALGVTAFQMLTGAPPFQSGTALGLFAAHMNQAVPSAATLRPATPAGLDAFVQRCLEKRPADRFQTAKDARDALDEVRNPAADGDVAQGNPSSLWHVPLRFFLGAAVILAATWVAIRAFALPDWVLIAAAALLVIGGVLTVISTHTAGQANAGRPRQSTTLDAITPSRVRRGGVVALSALAAVVALFMASRLTGIGPAATPLSAGALNERDAILLVDAGASQRDSLGLSITELLRIDLSQSRAFRLVERSRVRTALGRMQRADAPVLTEELAREVAVREGIKAYLVSTVVPSGSGTVLSARLIATATGESLVAAQQTVRTRDDLIAGVDKLAGKLRAQIGESLRDVRQTPPLAQITTSSLTALQLYAEAEREADRKGALEAVPLLDRAIAEDSMFAMAWRRKGTFLLNPGQPASGAAAGDSALARAWALRERLPERERFMVEASVADSRQQLDRAVAALRALLALYPGDPTAMNNLAVSLARLGRQREAMLIYDSLLAQDNAPAVTYSNQIFAAVGLGMLGKADAVSRKFVLAHPNSAELTMAAVDVALARLDEPAIDSLLRVAASGVTVERMVTLQASSTIAALHGRLRDADRLYRAALDARVQRSQLSAEEATILAEVAAIQRRVMLGVDTVGDLQRLDDLWPRLDRLTRGRRPWQRGIPPIVMLYSLLGKPEKARAIMTGLRADVAKAGSPAIAFDGRLLLTDAFVQLGSGNTIAADSVVRRACAVMANSFAACASASAVELAVVADRAGKPDSALVVYQRFAALRAARYFGVPGSLDQTTPLLAPAHRRIGELLDAKADTLGALDAYRRFLQYWDHADAPLQPVVNRVRQRIAELQRGVDVERRSLVDRPQI